MKNIRKTGDLPPSMVLYDTYKTAYIMAQAGIEEWFAHHSMSNLSTNSFEIGGIK